MQFLGTGAAELHPNPYCDCAVCERTRAEGEAPRLRSSFLVDEHTLIDLGADTLAASSFYRIPLSRLNRVFVTHTHDDHFSIPNISALTMADSHGAEYPIRFYLSAEALRWVEAYIEAVRPLHRVSSDLEALLKTGRIALEAVTPYVSFPVDGKEVVAVRSNHRVHLDETALHYLITLEDGRKLFYVSDSGLYSEENLAFLRGAGVDILIMEGTWGSVPLPRDDGHLNAVHFAEQLERFLSADVLHGRSAVYLTHINTRGCATHREYQLWLDEHAPCKVTVAKDGLRL